ncbi:hypothetical protein H5410_061828 [Solanum commersonii]|uniref:Uncharacterized protein n=1 Tax=Solanum commersonii TaxID=4109 RepID=A0A9J5WAT3_SOLCO|nr:hypothetical protein H5410_061828 [Solanum commersonii]
MEGSLFLTLITLAMTYFCFGRTALCLFYSCSSVENLSYDFNLWIMKDYGVKESWNKLFNIQSTDLYPITPKYGFSYCEVRPKNHMANGLNIIWIITKSTCLVFTRVR